MQCKDIPDEMPLSKARGVDYVDTSNELRKPTIQGGRSAVKTTTPIKKNLFFVWDKETDKIGDAAEIYVTYEKMHEYGKDFDTRSVAKDQIGPFFISTVFLLVDLFGFYFETMVFVPPSWRELYVKRYKTPSEARIGHKALVSKLLLDIETTPPDKIDWKKYE